MISLPAISVVTPFYNAASFLREAIESVLNQTFGDFELLLLNDGSTDNSVNIIQGYRDERIRLIHSKHDFIQTLNKGLDLARGKYIARMDADDIMLSTRLQEQFDFMEYHPEIDACGSWMQMFGEKRIRVECLTSHEEIVDLMIIGNSMAHSTMMLRNATLKVHHLHYKEDYLYAEDLKLWMDIARVGRLANIPKVLLLYRTSEEQVSVRKKEAQQKIANQLREEAIDVFLKRTDTLPVAETLRQTRELLKELSRQSIIPFNVYYETLHEIAKGIRQLYP